MRRNFVYCNCLIRYYRSRLNILFLHSIRSNCFGSSSVICSHCKRSYRLLDENVCEHRFFIYASHLKAFSLFAFALTYNVAWVVVCCISEGARLHGSTFSKINCPELFCFAQS